MGQKVVRVSVLKNGLFLRTGGRDPLCVPTPRRPFSVPKAGLENGAAFVSIFGARFWAVGSRVMV